MANTTPYLLLDTQDNPPAARVDKARLIRGGEPVPLTNAQAERLRDAGCHLRRQDDDESSTPPDTQPKPDTKEST